MQVVIITMYLSFSIGIYFYIHWYLTHTLHYTTLHYTLVKKKTNIPKHVTNLTNQKRKILNVILRTVASYSP